MSLLDFCPELQQIVNRVTDYIVGETSVDQEKRRQQNELRAKNRKQAKSGEENSEAVPKETTQVTKTVRESKRLYYAAAVTATTPLEQGDSPPFVFESFGDVVAFCKKYKNHKPRWKQLTNQQEAVEFSVSVKTKNDNCDVVLENINNESLPFPSPTPQQKVELRKCIEAGDVAAVIRLIDSNPRYLIGSGDTPTILHEGCRYNAFHVAAKANQAKVIEELLKRLRSSSYFQRLYPEDKEGSKDRIKFLLDMYLNTPDKTRNSETPLHFACKFGAYDSVKILLAQPECDSGLGNGNGRLAKEIICERDGGKAVREKIANLFEETVVIPILRDESENNAQIGRPVTPRELRGLLSPLHVSPCSAGKKLSACVGPLTSPRANEIMSDILKTRFLPAESKLRKTDAEKGVETVVRNVARRYGVPWTEIWDFLGRSVDLTSYEGLEELENYLNERYRFVDSVGFIVSDSPTKTDYQVWTALSPIVEGIESETLPFVSKWISNMRPFSADDMKIWRTPRKTSRDRTENNVEDCLVNLMSRFTLEDN